MYKRTVWGQRASAIVSSPIMQLLKVVKECVGWDRGESPYAPYVPTALTATEAVMHTILKVVGPTRSRLGTIIFRNVMLLMHPRKW